MQMMKEGKIIQKIERENIEVKVKTDVLKLDEILENFKGKSLEIEDLFDKKFYMMGVNKAYKEFFESRLKKAKINGHLEKPYNLWYNKLSTNREEKL